MLEYKSSIIIFLCTSYERDLVSSLTMTKLLNNNKKGQQAIHF